MKIAIHKKDLSFSDRWIEYCERNKVPYKIVDCYSTNIINELNDCDGLIWHWNQNDYKAKLCARQITMSLSKKGLKIFPNIDTSWHYDDKVGQKYLLEAINAPLVPSHVFYSKKEALEWANTTSFPKVFKLRGGAGSINVKLARTKREAVKLIVKAFNSGFSPINHGAQIKDRLHFFLQKKSLKTLIDLFKDVARRFIKADYVKYAGNEVGYIYFQDFIPENSFDTRLVVVGNRCIAMRRYCRENDFRASGSGVIAYEKELFDIRMVKIAFEVVKKIGSQSLAFDFITNGNSPLIIELSYCYTMGDAYDNCHGYWDENLEWHKEKINPQDFIIDDFINSINNN